MKTKVDVQSQIPATPVPILSDLTTLASSAATITEVVPDSQIQELAYKLFEERGRVDGNDQQDWFEAESILRERDKIAA